MNIQKIFTAVDNDDMNSPLISIINELENQGYKIKLEGVDVSSSDLDVPLFNDFEKATNGFKLELLKQSSLEQKFKIVFTGYHQFSFNQAN